MRRLLPPALLLMLAGCSLFARPEQHYVLFFKEWSAQLDTGADAVAADAAAAARYYPDRVVTVSGFADPEGSPQANKDISRLRAQVVTDLLVADGVPASRIRQVAVGAVGFASTSQESRRAEIVIGGS